MSGERRRGHRRSYLPAVEALEALRLFSGVAPSLPEVAAEHEPWALAPVIAERDQPADAAWDVALTSALVADWQDARPQHAELEPDPEAVAAGLAQLDRYLARAWYRGGVAPHRHDDCSQAVYLTLLEHRGRDGLDRLFGAVGRSGVRQVLSRDTPEGPEFFRAVDTVKKRAHRERSHQSLGHADEVATDRREGDRALWRDALEEAIARVLTPREADLMHATLRGETPMEIAGRWGLTPKTVSNEKTRAFSKLRDALVAELSD